MKVYDFLYYGDGRTKEYRILKSQINTFKETYGEVVDGQIRLNTSIPEVAWFFDGEVSEVISVLMKNR